MCSCGWWNRSSAVRFRCWRRSSGAEAIYADAASSDSYEEASRKLKNLVGVAVTKATLQRHGTRTGQEIRAVRAGGCRGGGTGGADSAGDRRHRSSDGRPRGRGRGLQAGGRSGPEDRGASEGQDQRRGQRPHRQRASGGTSEFGARLRQFGLWNGLFEAKELVVLSDGVPWVRTSHEKAPDGK